MATRVALLLLALAVLASMRAGSASAHANLERSEPAENAVLAQSPSEVLLHFSEELDLGASRVEVLDSSGNRIDNDDLTQPEPLVLAITLPRLPDGTYAVTWRNVSVVDGHPRVGVFGFTVGQAPPPGGFDPGQFEIDLGGPPRWLAATVRWTGYASFFALLGVAAFPLLILRPSLRRANVEGKGSDVWPIVVSATLVTLVTGTALALLMQAWTASGDATSMVNGDLADLAGSTRFGAIWWARAGLTILAAIAGVALLRFRSHSTLAQAALLFAAVFLPLTIALNGHGAADEDFDKLAIGFDWLHITAGGLWVGGLLLLVFVVPAAIATLDIEGRLRVLSQAIPRFSTLALVCVATVATTGFLQWLIILGNIDDTLHSQYGVTLLVKIGFFLSIVALGAVNLLVLRPAIAARLQQQAREPGMRLAATFRRIVATEVLFAIAVLSITAVLTTGSPPFTQADSTPQRGIVQTQETGEGIEITLAIDPGAAGRNTMDFLIDGVPDSEAIETLAVRFSYLDDRLGQTEDEATRVEAQHFRLTGDQLSLAGLWRIDIVGRRAGFADTRLRFEFTIGARPEPTPP